MTDTNVKNDDNNVLNENDEEYTDEMKKKDILFSRFQNLSKYMDNDITSSPETFENFSDLIIDDYDLYKFNNERFQFYMELKKILDKDPRILRMILNLNNKTKLKKKKERKILQKLTKIFAKIFKREKEKAVKQAEIDAKFKEDFDKEESEEQTKLKKKQEEKLKIQEEAENGYKEFLTNFSSNIEDELKKKYNFEASNFDKQKGDSFSKLVNTIMPIQKLMRNFRERNAMKKSGGAYYNKYIKPGDPMNRKNEDFNINKIVEKAEEKDVTSEAVNNEAAEEANKLYNLLAKTDYNEDNEDQLRGYLAYKYNLNNLQNLNKNILNIGSDDTNDRFSKDNSSMKTFVEDYYKAFNHSNPDKVNRSLKKAIEKMKDSPDNPLEVFKITREDRLVFILVTFFIRYVTILMVQWCVDINIIRDFYQGFLLYAFIYIVIFWFIVMFVNIDNIPKTTYMNFNSGITFIRNLFYYFYMGTNGITRLLTHTLLIIILLIIPIILNVRQKKEQESDNDLLNYEERKKLIKTLSLFTIFVWILTSIIATKY